MNNRRFYTVLRTMRDERNRPRWTVERIAEAIYSSRVTVSDALNNDPRRGGQTRPKLVRFFRKEFPEPLFREILEVLGWDETGQIVPRETLHVEQNVE